MIKSLTISLTAIPDWNCCKKIIFYSPQLSTYEYIKNSHGNRKVTFAIKNADINVGRKCVKYVPKKKTLKFFNMNFAKGAWLQNFTMDITWENTGGIEERFKIDNKDAITVELCFTIKDKKNLKSMATQHYLNQHE